METDSPERLDYSLPKPHALIGSKGNGALRVGTDIHLSTAQVILTTAEFSPLVQVTQLPSFLDGNRRSESCAVVEEKRQR